MPPPPPHFHGWGGGAWPGGHEAEERAAGAAEEGRGGENREGRGRAGPNDGPRAVWRGQEEVVVTPGLGVVLLCEVHIVGGFAAKVSVFRSKGQSHRSPAGMHTVCCVPPMNIVISGLLSDDWSNICLQVRCKPHIPSQVTANFFKVGQGKCLTHLPMYDGICRGGCLVNACCSVLLVSELASVHFAGEDVSWNPEVKKEDDTAICGLFNAHFFVVFTFWL